ncbi:DUF418 domain-containing protein [Paenibacillus sp. N1-5-1-14]|uniref:DUF418 domain-containing protein n=1 Tax=Paenibacillus radicibacter TaxID=2972488 RepID=UPI002159AF63|nr:DUF418 domain-containing protein [Paenibacillus radicibacter]MCR8643439.1 DUF418 domain-containing protein [Paenibacillus radicibacter]
MIIKPNRIGIIDGLRGFSLFGILMANMLIFQYGMWGQEEIRHFFISQWDTNVLTFLKILVVGSFMPIFTFMFGFGLIKMQENLLLLGKKPKRTLSRRFLLLIVLGFLHSYFLWEGDILLFYGLMGFFLFLFLNRKPKTLLIWSIILLLLLCTIGINPGSSNDSITIASNLRMEAYIKETINIYGSGTYEQIMYHRQYGDPLGLPNFMMIIMIFIAPIFTAPMFLIGMYAAKKGWFSNHSEKRAIYRKLMLIFIPLGIAIKSIGYIFPGYWWSKMGEIPGGTVLAIGYIFAFVSLFTRKESSKWLFRFQAVGKLSLTNYLMQTVICTTLFYGYGLGWFGKIGVLAGCGLALAIYLLQLFLSPIYLRKFQYGPVERLLRMWTNWSLSGKAKQSKKQDITNQSSCIRSNV